MTAQANSIDQRQVTVDGNEAVASVAHRVSEVVAIYPITPSSTMGELADEWSSHGRTNVWGVVPSVVEMQSEGGAAGAMHGAVQAGALTTTFTASQGLLLMIPNMYKMAGELSSAVIHVAARTLATHALSIFGDHSDVYACRQTGFALLASGSVQEAHDLAAVAHAATLRSRIPFLHFFDGFRTSHEINRIEELTDEDLRALLDEKLIQAHRARALSPDHPFVRGTAQNPDTFFQAREAANSFYDACPEIVQSEMDRLFVRTGRRYRLFDYVGHPRAERVVIVMGSGAETVHETVDALTARGERVGVLKVRLYRPFSIRHFLEAIPPSCEAIAVLDRTKEPGAPADPLHLDVMAALSRGRRERLSGFEVDPDVVGGRYGLSSKEFTPAMVKAIFDQLALPKPKDRFTMGIVDDVTHTSLPFDASFDLESPDVFRGVFYGLGSDGTVGANKNSIKIIAEESGDDVQAYFVYDSKKAGATTVSHLRFGPRKIRAPYLITRANFVACHHSAFLERFDILDAADRGATVLLNTSRSAEEVWNHFPREAQEAICEKNLRLFVIDADALARECGLGRRINTIMQTAFFAISGILPLPLATERIKDSIRKSYGKKDAGVVETNCRAVDRAAASIREVEIPAAVTATRKRPPIVSEGAPDLVRTVTGMMLAGKGDLLPVSAFPPDGTWPSGTAKWEKRGLALELPVWDESLCIQCNKCVFVCPHAAIRAKVYVPAALGGAPAGFKSMDYKSPEFAGSKYTIQVAPEDCTGCTLCVHVCPAKDKTNPGHKSLDMKPAAPLITPERASWEFFQSLAVPDRTKVRPDLKGSQFLEPLFEFSGACVGCGETPYVKLLTQLFGDRALIANATGCSSIFGGNLPTTPYTINCAGRGPAWSNSLFEDNAEFGLGFRLAVDQATEVARGLLRGLAPAVGESLAGEILSATMTDEAGIGRQRERVEALRKRLAEIHEFRPDSNAFRLALVADALVRKSVWIVGGDGWAYDIGFGGVDHVLSLGSDVNLLVLDTEGYSNTGGQASKATPIGAVAKFATSGKSMGRKDLGLMAMSYGHVYVAQVAFGAKDSQTHRAFLEAESYPGPSLVIAYGPCISHGYDLADGHDHQKAAVQTGFWPLYRFDPRKKERGENPFVLDSGEPSQPFEAFAKSEGRFRMLMKSDPERASLLMADAEREIATRFERYRMMAAAPAAGRAAPIH